MPCIGEKKVMTSDVCVIIILNSEDEYCCERR